MIGKKDWLLLTHFRKNARKSLTNISRETRIPVSTIFDKLKKYEGALIKKHTSLLDFGKLGFSIRTNILIKSDKDSKINLQEFLLKNCNVNSVYKIDSGFDFLIEGIFKHIKELHDFLEKLEENFKIEAKQVYYIVDELKREAFLSNPQLLDMIGVSSF